MYEAPWQGEPVVVGIRRVGDEYSFLVDGQVVKKDTLTILEEPYFDGPMPVLVGILAGSGKNEASVCFDNLQIDNGLK